MLIALLVAGIMLGRPAIQGWLGSRQPLPVGGRLIMPTESGIGSYDLGTRQSSTLLQTALGELISAVDWSPDQEQIAYGFFHRRPGDPASVSEIYVMRSNGSDSRPLAERDRPGDVLDAPVWSADGRQVYFSFFGLAGGRPVQRIELVARKGGDRQTVVEDGFAPALSPDGRTLYYLRDERAGTGLWSTELPGGQPTQVIPAGKYPGLAVPRISPDGQRIAVAVLNSPTAERLRPGLFDWFRPSIAYAHGLPWDIWTFNLEGADPRRLTNVNADDPSPAWSPDGQYIAFWGGTGLYLVKADGSNVLQLLERGGYGPIDWVP